MTIESYHERLQAEIDKIFAANANQLVASARVDDGRHRYLAGAMDALTEVGKVATETYKLFVSDGDREAEDEQQLY